MSSPPSLVKESDARAGTSSASNLVWSASVASFRNRSEFALFSVAPSDADQDADPPSTDTDSSINAALPSDPAMLIPPTTSIVAADSPTTTVEDTSPSSFTNGVG